VLSSRIRWLERGIGLDRLFVLHRLSGRIGITLMLVHPLALSAPSMISGYGYALSWWKVVGALALILACAGVGAALLYRRLRWQYEVWKAIHKASYAVLPLALVHSLFLGSDLSRGPLRAFWFVLAGVYVFVLICRVRNWAFVRSRPFTVTEVVQETHDTWSIHLRGRQLEYRPGQFMFVQLIRGGRVSEPHPFTISSAPTRDGLSITVKSVGDFTSTVGDTKLGDRALVDAPYGIFTFLRYTSGDLVFISGGIGITPFLSMLRYMCDTGSQRAVTLLCANKTEHDIPRREELASLAHKMTSLEVVHVMSGQPDWCGEKGYIDADMVSRHIGDLEGLHFLICGPPRMMTMVIRELHKLDVTDDRIHHERFALR
jgi:predicted ferric reductase